jgi:putative Holliday junction resolvase
MTYLGLDLGSKTLGVAISYSGILATNLVTIRFSENSYDEALTKLGDILKDQKIDLIVLGLPKHMNNDVGIRANISIEFGQKITQKYDIKVEYQDERLSTLNALDALKGKNPKKRKALVDNVAAMIILQEWLDRRVK